MKIFVIADNQETEVGLKLAGCDGITLEKEEEIIKKIDEVMQDTEIGVLVITKNIYKLSKEKIDYIRLNKKLPLITIIWKEE